jgi:hypothetical protein
MKPQLKATLAGFTALLLLDACVQKPMGPTVQVMPAPNKPFPVFQQDDASCRQFADQSVAGQAEQANNQAIGTAVIGTALGAGLGAAIGGGRGAAIGAGAGALGGTAVASGPANAAQYTIQQRYDMAYAQCMYSRGNQIPGYAATPAYSAPPPGYSAPPPGYSAPPPPPPGYPPPPPPGYSR